MQARLKVTEDGVVTLEKNVLDHLGVKPGDTLVVDLTAPGRAEVKAAGKHGIERIFGSLKNEHGIHLTLEEIEEAIQKGWAGEL